MADTIFLKSIKLEFEILLLARGIIVEFYKNKSIQYKITMK